MKRLIYLLFLITLIAAHSSYATRAQAQSETKGDDKSEIGKVVVTHSKLTGIGDEKDVMRRDPSDVIKVGDLYYVWYSKGTISPGYDATVFYATSTDGKDWTEKGESVVRGPEGEWDGASVFTPNILVAEGKYYLFFTGTSRPFH